MAKLKKSWYGLQDATNIWQEDHGSLLFDHGHQSGKSNEAVFVCPDDDSRTIDHGDDFAVFGDDESVNSFERMLKSYTFQRLAGLGFEEGDDKHGVFLNRATVGTKGQPRMVVYLHDSRHATLLIRVLELEKAPGAETPVAHCSSESKAETLNAELKCARAADLVQDAPTISEAAKSLSRRMSAPSDANYQMFKREGNHNKILWTRIAHRFVQSSLPPPSYAATQCT